MDGRDSVSKMTSSADDMKGKPGNGVMPGHVCGNKCMAGGGVIAQSALEIMSIAPLLQMPSGGLIAAL